MIYYIFPYIYSFLTALLIYSLRLKRIRWWHLFIIVLPGILLFALRGNVGTDTYFYLGLLDDYSRYGESLARYEPGFELLGKTLAKTGLSPRFALATISIITTLLVCKAYSATKRQMLLLALVVFPLYFYDFTMNGIRYGLSFSLATIAIDKLYQKKNRAATIWSLLAFSVQYSSLLVILPFVGGLIKKKYVIVIGLILVLAFFGLPQYFGFIVDRIAGKQDAYSDIVAPSIFSGVAPLFIVFLMYVNFLRFHINKPYDKLIHAIFLFEVLSFVLSKFTYAGLRFQGAFMYCMILYLKNHSDEIDSEKIKKYIAGYVVISMLGIFLFIKNISANVEGDLSPFIPYKFYWQESNRHTL